MNRTELIQAVTKKTGLPKRNVEAAVNGMLGVVTEALCGGEKVQVSGFGAFEVRSRPARIAHNPKTGDMIQVPASKAPVFRAGKDLKTAVQ